jgi:hypothetical protein
MKRIFRILTLESVRFSSGQAGDTGEKLAKDRGRIEQDLATLKRRLQK